MENLNNKSSSSFEDLIKKYEKELSIIKSDYEQNQEKIRQELYQIISEKQESKIETNREKKRNKTLQKFFYHIKRLAKKNKKYFRNIIKSRKKCEN